MVMNVFLGPRREPTPWSQRHNGMLLLMLNSSSVSSARFQQDPVGTGDFADVVQRAGVEMLWMKAS